jgi:hypothetical protein
LALDTLRDQLRVGANRGRIAFDLLHKVGLTNADVLAGIDILPAQDNDQILAELLDAEVRRRRAAIQSEDPDDDFNIPPTAPITEDERQAALEYLLSLASEPDPEPSSAGG